MPWKETCAVSERNRLVDLIVREGIPAAEASRMLGVSRKTAYKWLARHDELGRSGLTDRSRARRSQPHATCAAVQGLLIELRKETGDGPR
jgi:transposase